VVRLPRKFCRHSPRALGAYASHVFGILVKGKPAVIVERSGDISFIKANSVKQQAT
jgi:hypothetical protein